MGFKVKRKSYKLVFGAGNDLEGAEIIMGPMTTGEFITIYRSSQGVEAEQAVSATGVKMIDTVAGKLVSWNLEEEDGTPIPATKDGVLGLDFDLVSQIVRAWTAAAKGVSGPLPEGSSDGATPPPLEVSIPTETLSPSPQS